MKADGHSDLKASGTRNGESELQGIVPLIPVADLDAARQFYGKLGFRPLAQNPSLVERDDERLQLAVKTPPYVGPVSITILARGVAKLRPGGAASGGGRGVSAHSVRYFTLTVRVPTAILRHTDNAASRQRHDQRPSQRPTGGA